MRGGWLQEEPRATRNPESWRLPGWPLRRAGRSPEALHVVLQRRRARAADPGAGDSFGEAIMFNSIPSPVFVETLSAVNLAYLPRQVISDALVRSLISPRRCSGG